jgi:hypothetical protein
LIAVLAYFSRKEKARERRMLMLACLTMSHAPSLRTDGDQPAFPVCAGRLDYAEADPMRQDGMPAMPDGHCRLRFG